MKILHCNTIDNQGGAAIAAHRLHCALNGKENRTSIMGVKYKTSDELNIQALPLFSNRFVQKIVNKIDPLLLRLFRPNKRTYFSAQCVPNNVVDTIREIAPDIIHLHWLADFFMGPAELKALAKLDIPVVWTLHDTWAFTGGCHYYGDCKKWLTQCENCPCLTIHGRYDMSAWQWKAKYKAYRQLRPTIVALSNAFQDDIHRSALLGGLNCCHIPNPVDTTIFRPIPQETARLLLGLDQDKQYLLFGAASATRDPRKGYDLLTQALSQIGDTKNRECLVFGASHGDNSLPLPVRYLGQLHDELTLALAYSASDVFVCPSREESFSLTTLESLACGVPVAAFSVGGIPDMIEHGVNGMLAAPQNTQELGQGIACILEDAERRQRMGEAARRTALERYSMPVVAEQYIALYEKLLNRNHD